MAVPKADYLSRDFSGLKQSLLDYASQSFPEWQPASEGDFGMVLLELFAYVGDVISYNTDRAQFENYLPTATQRDSVLNIAYLLGYVPHSGAPATGTVQLVTDAAAGGITVPAGTQIQTPRIDALDGPVTFETNADAVLLAGGATNPPTAVTEGTTVSYVKIGESTGQPGQTFSLPNTGVYRDTIRLFVEDVNGSTTLSSGTATIKLREWMRVDHLLDSSSTDLVFETVETSGTSMVLLGDDINGAIPATGLSIYATYRHGVGSQGNVAVGQVRLINSTGLGTVHVRRDNSGAYLSTAMTGGADPESTESIRYNAPRAYRTQERAVTLEDYRDIALGVEGVSKANVVAGTFTSVTVYIAGSDGGTPSDTLKQLVADRYSGRTLAGVSVTVAAPTFIPVNLGTSPSPMVVTLYPQYSQKTVKAAVDAAIRTFITGLAFGEKMTVGKVYDVVNAVEGVRYVEIPIMARNDTAQTGVVPLTPRLWEIFTPGTFYYSMAGGVA